MDDEIKLTREEWMLLKQVMRTLTWGKCDASNPWYKLVDSVESRFPEAKAIESRFGIKNEKN